MTTLQSQTPALTSKHPFLIDMDPRHVEILLHGATEQQFEPGEIIFREGEPANRFYLINWGEVALETKCPDYGMVHVQTLHRGDVLGWSWLFAPFAWNFQARTIKDTRVIACDGAHLLVTSEEDDEFGHALMKRVAHVTIRRLQGARRQLIQVQSVLAGKPATSA
ncbi:MAG TPA: cyclic nucleotide-binding domain-containing protein [Methylomirabilota bacterium]|nr:cyclic nucleotide-binding domain-containing protein [Methylomirabilota bacterium]